MEKKDWKKELAEKKISEGDKRSYNEIMADIELQIWHERYSQPSPQSQENQEINK